jgi:hypothetical protein
MNLVNKKRIKIKEPLIAPSLMKMLVLLSSCSNDEDDRADLSNFGIAKHKKGGEIPLLYTLERLTN